MAKNDPYLSYSDARDFAITLRLHERTIVRQEDGRKNDARNKWNDYCLGLYSDLPPKPSDIPSSIHYAYKDKGPYLCRRNESNWEYRMV